MRRPQSDQSRNFMGRSLAVLILLGGVHTVLTESENVSAQTPSRSCHGEFMLRSGAYTNTGGTPYPDGEPRYQPGIDPLPRAYGGRKYLIEYLKQGNSASLVLTTSNDGYARHNDNPKIVLDGDCDPTETTRVIRASGIAESVPAIKIRVQDLINGESFVSLIPNGTYLRPKQIQVPTSLVPGAVATLGSEFEVRGTEIPRTSEPESTPVPPATQTATPTRAATATPTLTPTVTVSATRLETQTPIPTATSIATSTATLVRTETPRPSTSTSTSTATATSTEIPRTASPSPANSRVPTSSPIPFVPAPLPETSTPTFTAIATATETPKPVSDSGNVPFPCDVNSVAWKERGPVYEGENISGVIIGVGNCDGREAIYSIVEDDPVFDDVVEAGKIVRFTGNTAEFSWQATYQDEGFFSDPRYYIEASIAGKNSKKSENIVVNQSPNRRGLLQKLQNLALIQVPISAIAFSNFFIQGGRN